MPEWEWEPTPEVQLAWHQAVALHDQGREVQALASALDASALTPWDLLPQHRRAKPVMYCVPGLPDTWAFADPVHDRFCIGPQLWDGFAESVWPYLLADQTDRLDAPAFRPVPLDTWWRLDLACATVQDHLTRRGLSPLHERDVAEPDR